MDIARAAGLRYAERVARLCAPASDEPVAGVILHGSLVLGDYVPDRSDVDVLAVVESNLTESQIDALADAVDQGRAAGRLAVARVRTALRRADGDDGVQGLALLRRAAPLLEVRGGRVALSREPSLPAVHQALRRRHFDPAALIAEAPVRELLAFVRKRVAEAAGARG